MVVYNQKFCLSPLIVQYSGYIFAKNNMSGKHEDEQDVPDDGSVIQRDDSTVASSAQDAGWRRAVSIHAVLSVTAITGIVMTVTFAELLGETSCDAGLEDTRASMQRATDMQFSSSVDALDGITRDLLGYSQIGMHGMVKSFLQECLQEMNGMAVTLETFVQDQNKTEDWMQPALPALWHQTAMLLPDSAVYALGIYSNIHGRSYYQTPNGPMMLSFNDDFPERNMYATVRSDGSGIPLAKFSDLNSSVSGLYTTKLVTYDFVRFGDTRFSNIVPVGQDVGMVVVQKFRDGTGTFPYLATSAFVQLSKIEAYIRNIVSSDDNTTHATPRVFLVVARSWLAEALRDANDPEWEKMDQSGYLTAVSHGTSTEQVEGPSSLQGGVTNLTYPILASRASDPYISAIAVALEGNYSRCEGKHLPVMLEVDGGQEEHFVGAQRVELNEGLEWWLVMSLDSMSIFGSVRKAQDEMNVLIAEDVSEVADTIERNRISARIVVCAVGASIGLLILYVSFVVVRPIKNLQVKMQRVAGMDLAGLSLEATSLFSEVRSMQVDFRRMVENLVEYRAYVPSSILDGSSPTAKRRRDLDPPTGCIAVVFTDIKGSTELWRLSPSDMNVAMEHHNDEIRAACGAHSGYEVKTIGDSFMVSFSEPLRAALFTMEVLARFAKRKWPAGLMLPDAGLVLRIGVNCGPTIAETNPVTGRVDYRGGTVNLASRVEGKARPGTVCMTADFYAAVKADVATLNVSVLDVGVQEVKGLGAGYQLYLMVPDTLKCRFDDADTDCVLRRRASTVGFQNEVVHESPPGSVAETTSSGSVPVVHHNTKKELRGKTALQVARSGVTVAVCRLVCVHIIGTICVVFYFLPSRRRRCAATRRCSTTATSQSAPPLKLLRQPVGWWGM